MCGACLKEQVDVTEGIPEKGLVIVQVCTWHSCFALSTMRPVATSSGFVIRRLCFVRKHPLLAVGPSSLAVVAPRRNLERLATAFASPSRPYCCVHLMCFFVLPAYACPPSPPRNFVQLCPEWQCRRCLKWLTKNEHWSAFELESAPFLALVLKKIPGLAKQDLVDAKWVWTGVYITYLSRNLGPMFVCCVVLRWTARNRSEKGTAR